jgi:hypothetical protein
VSAGERDERRVDEAIDAVDQMADIVDGFEQYVVRAASREHHGNQYRVNLLWVHAVAALMIAPLLSATGRGGLTGPTFAFLRTLPGTPYSLSTILGTGGFILGIGCVFRHKIIEAVGLVGLLIFYLVLAVSFAVPPLRWLAHSGSVKPPFYSPIVYVHLAVVMAMHIYALLVRNRDEQLARTLVPGLEKDGDAP